MKKTLSLSTTSITALEVLSQERDITQSSIVETALHSYLRWLGYKPSIEKATTDSVKGQTTIDDYAR